MTARALRLGSLFSGIGGLDLGVMLALAQLGVVARTLFHVEKDAFCREVLAAHWPDALRFEDIATLDTSTLPRVDLLHGGFPCQTVSLAGQRKAQNDDCWLWPEFARVLRDLRPRIAFLENTPGLLSAGADGRGGALGEVLGDMAALGYRAWWTCVRASDVGAPHLRERWFCLAALGDADGIAPHRLEPLGLRERCGASEPGGGRAELADAEGDGVGAAHLRVVPVTRDLARGTPASGGDRAGRGPDNAGAGGEARGDRGAQPSLGGDPDGLPRGVDGRGPLLAESAEVLARLEGHRWPAGRGEAQHPHEPPRVIRTCRRRVHRVAALGNAVVPQAAALAFLALACRAHAEGVTL